MSAKYSSTIIQVPPYRYSSTWLIGAATHAVDRYVADVERIFQPDRDHIGGTIRFELSDAPVTVAPKDLGPRRSRWKIRLRPPPLIDVGTRVLFDVRENHYFNWSHQVNLFLTLALAARSTVGQSLTIVLPTRMPPAASALYEQFHFPVISTDGLVKGRNLAWSVSDNEVVASARPQLIGPFMSEHDADTSVFPGFDLPPNVFLSRRGTRAITNEAEIQRLLSAKGFTKLYAEDLTVPQQFALFRQADQVVAIHGAGLAPLQYRSPSRPGMRLVELAPAGIVTRWFGIMCEQVGGKYIAVRGSLKAEYLDGLYAPEPFLSYCDDSFDIDPKSLELALEMIGSI